MIIYKQHDSIDCIEELRHDYLCGSYKSMQDFKEKTAKIIIKHKLKFESKKDYKKWLNQVKKIYLCSDDFFNKYYEI